jgi:hypothetical protein
LWRLRKSEVSDAPDKSLAVVRPESLTYGGVSELLLTGHVKQVQVRVLGLSGARGCKNRRGARSFPALLLPLTKISSIV